MTLTEVLVSHLNSEEKKKTVLPFLNKMEEYMKTAVFESGLTLDRVLPVTSYITSIAFNKNEEDGYQNHILLRNPEYIEKVLEKIDVAKIAEGLDNVYSKVEPMATLYIPHADMCVELSEIYSKSYVLGLSAEVKKEAELVANGK